MPMLGTRGAASAKGFGLTNSGLFVPAIGSAFEGGYFAGLISTSANSVPTHYLIVAPYASGNSSQNFQTSPSASPATSIIDGPGNGALLNTSTYPASKFCLDLTIGSYSDWYLPARDELEICYYNLKPGTGNNTTSNGSNAYSVPRRNSNYTTTVPGQTSATDFQTGGTEDFAASNYWSSTTGGSLDAAAIRFSDGVLFNQIKDEVEFARAVRRVAV